MIIPFFSNKHYIISYIEFVKLPIPRYLNEFFKYIVSIHVQYIPFTLINKTEVFINIYELVVDNTRYKHTFAICFISIGKGAIKS